MGCVLEELLSSFTEVKKCSQEGREQMGMDTNAIYNYATSLCDIQPANDAKDLKYVMDYLTCCKLEQPADVLAWAEKHKDDYSLEVVNSILNYAMAKKLSKQDLKDLKESIDRLYAEEEPEEETLSMKLNKVDTEEKEEVASEDFAKLMNLLSSDEKGSSEVKE